MTGEKLTAFDFDTWSDIATRDPDAFETLRHAAIEELIARAPAERRPRLRSLQWRIDQERRRARTPLGACIRISRMMWERVVGREGLLDNLRQIQHGLDDPRRGIAARERTAQVIRFARD